MPFLIAPVRTLPDHQASFPRHVDRIAEWQMKGSQPGIRRGIDDAHRGYDSDLQVRALLRQQIEERRDLTLVRSARVPCGDGNGRAEVQHAERTSRIPSTAAALCERRIKWIDPRRVANTKV